MKKIEKIRTLWTCRRELLLENKIKIDFIAFQKEWRKQNSHNSTTAGCKFDINKVSVGDGTYGTLNIHCWDNPLEQIRIGSFCSIAEDVHFILGGAHPLDRITTFPYEQHVMGWSAEDPTGTKGPIIVEDDVWICYGATILSGVTIGKGSVIGANSTIAKDIPPYSVVIDGKVARKRFSEEIIEKLFPLDLHHIARIPDESTVREILHSVITEDTIDDLTSKMS